MSYASGIDISNIQGPDYNWSQWSGKLSFAMAKASQGTSYLDPDFQRNWDSMWWLNGQGQLCRFAYHYGDPSQPAGSQVATFTNYVKRFGLMPGDNLVLDLELNQGKTPAEVSSWAQQFLHGVNGACPGHRVLVYTYPAFAQAGNCAGLNPWCLWIANYGVGSPEVPAPWKTWTFWQHSDTPVDTDYFNGTEAQLRAFCRKPS